MAHKPSCPASWGNDRLEEWQRKAALVINQIQKGQANNAFKVSLEENKTSTEVLVSFAASDQIAQFSAQDAATAGEIAAGTIWAVVTKGKITINHGSSAGVRTLGVTLHG